jgi:hydrogenase/urease accessory protein HupE
LRIAAGLLLALLWIAWPSLCLAHQVGLSRGTYQLHGHTVTASSTFSNADLALTIPELDLDHNGALSREELTQGKATFQRAVVDGTESRHEGQLCPGLLDSVTLTEGDGIEVQARYDCKHEAASVSLAFEFLDRFPAGHRHLASTTIQSERGTSTTDALVTIAANTMTLIASPADVKDVKDVAKSQTTHSTFGIFALGVEHILTGYDHLAFLLGLILLANHLRSVLAMVTAFTVAHSITLASAAFGWWAPAPAFVEPAIALSIVYVALENLVAIRKQAMPVGRWKLTFPFGLIHGFGFAGALRELQVERHALPWVLGAFNLGVEVGQLGVLACFWGALLLLRTRPTFRTHGAMAISLALGIAGVIWFAMRIASAA